MASLSNEKSVQAAQQAAIQAKMTNIEKRKSIDSTSFEQSPALAG